jgi:hypothetical protein
MIPGFLWILQQGRENLVLCNPGEQKVKVKTTFRVLEVAGKKKYICLKGRERA